VYLDMVYTTCSSCITQLPTIIQTNTTTLSDIDHTTIGTKVTLYVYNMDKLT